jgi:hypothetical protein
MRLHNRAGQCHDAESGNRGEQSVDDQEEASQHLSQGQVSFQPSSFVFSKLEREAVRQCGQLRTVRAIPGDSLGVLERNRSRYEVLQTRSANKPPLRCKIKTGRNHSAPPFSSTVCTKANPRLSLKSPRSCSGEWIHLRCES